MSQLDTYQQALDYLDTIWKAKGDMFKTVPYLRETYVLSDKEAQEILLNWMRTFDIRNPKR